MQMTTKPSYWQQQIATKPLFPDIAWSKPEQKSQAGRLLILGGNKLGFAGVAEAYDVANKNGVGYSKVFLPDSLKKTIPKTMTDIVFGASNPSGSLSKQSQLALKAMGEWADGILMIGDAGRNSETAILYTDFLQDSQKPITISRDAFDLIKTDIDIIAERENTLLVLSFAQLQKLFQLTYFPKVLTFSMHVLHLVEALHKFTLSYPVAIQVLHRDLIFSAYNGKVITQEWNEPMRIWRGSVAAKSACYWLWNKNKPIEAITTSLTKE